MFTKISKNSYAFIFTSHSGLPVSHILSIRSNVSACSVLGIVQHVHLNVDAPVLLTPDVVRLYKVGSRKILASRGGSLGSCRLTALGNSSILLNVELLTVGKNYVLVLTALLVEAEEHFVGGTLVVADVIREVNADRKISFYHNLVRVLEQGSLSEVVV